MKKLLVFLLALTVILPAMGQEDSLRRALAANERGGFLMEEGRFGDASAAYRQALDLYPAGDGLGRTIILHNLIDALVCRGSFAEAIGLMDKIDLSSLAGDMGAEMRNLKANLLSTTGRKSEAYGIWEALLLESQDSPYFTLYALNAVMTAIELGEIAWSRATLFDVLNLADNPRDSLDAYRLMALATLEAGKPRLAMKDLDKAWAVAGRSFPDDSYESLMLKNTTARIREKEERFAEAADLYCEVAEGLTGLIGKEHPAVFSALYGRARCLLGDGQYAMAVQCYLQYAGMKRAYLSREITRLKPDDLRAFWVNNREGIVDAPLFAAVADEAAVGEIFNMVLLSKSFTFDCLREVNVSPSWKEIADRMPRNSVAVEYTEYTGLDGIQRTCAFVYRRDSASPQFVPLPATGGLVYSVLDDSGEGGRKLYDAVWAPLEQWIRPVDTVYFSPSASLSRLPLEYALDGTGTIAASHFSALVRTITTRDIPTVAAPRKIERAILFGNMDYERSDRGYYVDFPFLKWSAPELEALQKAVSDMPSAVYSGADASEQSFRSEDYSDGRNEVLYLSTHGLYASPAEAIRMAYYSNRYSERELEDNPLLRSVMVFSGASDVWGSESVPPSSEDETLTAQEISEMDLSGVSLAVLAACQTGQSDSDPEMFGFPRAFKLAGAGPTIVSLWKVNDEATCLLMVSLMNHISAGYSPEESLRLAVEDLRGNPEFREPFFWAPFVMVH